MSLLQQAQQPQQAAPRQGGAQQTQAYHKFVGQIADFLYSEKGVKMISEAFKSGAPIEDVIPMIVSRLFEGIAVKSREANTRLPPDMVLPAMIEVLSAVMEMAVEAGLIDKGQGEEMGQGAFLKSMQQLDKRFGKAMPGNDRDQYLQLIQHMTGGQQ